MTGYRSYRAGDDGPSAETICCHVCSGSGGHWHESERDYWVDCETCHGEGGYVQCVTCDDVVALASPTAAIVVDAPKCEACAKEGR